MYACNVNMITLNPDVIEYRYTDSHAEYTYIHTYTYMHALHVVTDYQIYTYIHTYIRTYMHALHVLPDDPFSDIVFPTIWSGSREFSHGPMPMTPMLSLRRILYVCMYVCVCIRTRLRPTVFKHTHTHIHTYIHTYIHTHAYSQL
jgi:hypothetical protein